MIVHYKLPSHTVHSNCSLPQIDGVCKEFTNFFEPIGGPATPVDNKNRLPGVGSLSVYASVMQRTGGLNYSFPNDCSAASVLSYMGIFCRNPVMPSTL